MVRGAPSCAECEAAIWHFFRAGVGNDTVRDEDDDAMEMLSLFWWDL